MNRFTQYRIAIVGCTGVGKTSITRQMVEHQFVYQHQVTSETVSSQVQLYNYQGKNYIFTLEDTVGIDDDRDAAEILKANHFFLDPASMVEPTESDSLLGGAKMPAKKVSGELRRHGYILVYDLGNPRTLNKVRIFVEQLRAMHGYDPLVPNAEGMPTPFIVVGNKLDKRMAKTELDDVDKEGSQFAGSYNAPYMETSARLNKDVRKIFEVMVDEIERRMRPKVRKQRVCCWCCVTSYCTCCERDMPITPTDKELEYGEKSRCTLV